MSQAQPIRIDYTNHRGERAWRRVLPAGIRWGSAPPWHVEEQWLMRAYDVDRDTVRDFAVKMIHDWEFPS